MKTTEALKTMRSKDAAELLAHEASLREELFNLKFRLSIGQLENTARIPAVQREIAQVLTVLREKQSA